MCVIGIRALECLFMGIEKLEKWRTPENCVSAVCVSVCL